jgi:predicted O-methyltransferase YrrM
MTIPTAATAPTASTLTTAPVAGLLARLFAEAQTSNAELRRWLGALTAEERAARITGPGADYRALYGQARDLYLAVSPATGRLLYLLARATGARGIVEFGTSFGVSTLHLAAALRDNGGGRLIGSELEPGKIERALDHLRTAGLADLVEIRAGDALDTLAHDLPDAIDLVLLDGHKPLYSRVLDLVAPHLRPGACLVADNADACPDYLARVRAPDGGYLSLALPDDVELSIAL